MDKNINMRAITLKELWELFVRKLLVVVLVAVLVGGGALAYNIVTYTPEYESTATLYILRQNESTTTGDAADDFSLALKVVNDCTYLLKSHAVLDEVISTLDLNMNYKELYSRVSTRNPENTRVLEVTVSADKPELAQTIVDTLCTIGQEKIDAVMGFEQINLFELGTLNAKPSNGYNIINCVLYAVAAAVLTYSAYMIYFLLDDRIHAEDDLEKMLGLSILGDIPDANAKHKEGYGYYTDKKGKSGRRVDNRKGES